MLFLYLLLSVVVISCAVLAYGTTLALTRPRKKSTQETMLDDDRPNHRPVTDFSLPAISPFDRSEQERAIDGFLNSFRQQPNMAFKPKPQRETSYVLGGGAISMARR